MQDKVYSIVHYCLAAENIRLHGRVRLKKGAKVVGVEAVERYRGAYEGHTPDRKECSRVRVTKGGD
jgi:hypothetical protein